MRIVIAGCGRVGGDLARRLAEEGHDVSVIDDRPGAFKQLGSTFNGLTLEGKGYDVRVLKEAGIEVADAFVAATNSDNGNVMSVQLAKQLFGVPRAIARLDDPLRADSYQALGIEFVAGAKLTALVIHELVVDSEFHYHVAFGSGDVEVVEMEIGTAGKGMTVRDFEIEDGIRVAAVRRKNRTHIPDAKFELAEGDLVVAATRRGRRDKVKRYLRESR